MHDVINVQDMCSHLNMDEHLASVNRFSRWKGFQFNIFTCWCHTVPVCSVKTPWHAGTMFYLSGWCQVRLTTAGKDTYAQAEEKESKNRTIAHVMNTCWCSQSICFWFSCFPQCDPSHLWNITHLLCALLLPPIQWLAVHNFIPTDLLIAQNYFVFPSCSNFIWKEFHPWDVTHLTNPFPLHVRPKSRPAGHTSLNLQHVKADPEQDSKISRSWWGLFF